MRTVRRIAYRRVYQSWLNTVFTLFVIVILFFLTGAVVAGVGGYQLVIDYLEGGVAFAITLFFLQEIVVVLMMRAELASRDELPDFHRALDELMKGRWMLRPKLFVIKMPRMEEVPNAVAFGPGVFGWYSIGITRALYELMTYDELKAIVAHEFGHIKSKDTGLMTVLAFVLNGTSTFASGLKASGNAFTVAVGWILHFVSKYVFPISQAALSQEREYAADALAAMFVGSPEPLISALEKLQRELNKSIPKKKSESGIFSDLYLSHPRMEHRIKALRELGASE